MKPRPAFVLVAFIVISSTAVSAESETKGPHFRIRCHFDNDAIAKEVLETAEAAWKAAQSLFGEAEASAGQPMEVHLYPDVEAYRAAEGKLTAGEFRNEPGFAHHESRSVHLCLQPLMSSGLLKTVGLPALTRRRVAREVSQLGRSAALPNHTSHPRWLADGAALYLAERVMRSNKWGPSVNGDPFFSTYASHLKRMLDAQRLPPISSMLQDSVQSLTAGERDGLRWALFRFLRKGDNAPMLDKIIAEAGRLQPGGTYLVDLYVFADKAYGGDGFAQLNEAFCEYVRGLKPKWDESYPSLEVRPKEWLQIAYPDNNAVAWRAAPAESKSFSIQGELQVLPAQVQQMNILLARSADGFVSVAFVGNGGVGIMLYDRKNKSWKTLASGKSKMLKTGKKTRFQVQVDGTRVNVFIRKRLVVKVELNGVDFSGPWGVGVQAESAGIWYGVGLAD